MKLLKQLNWHVSYFKLVLLGDSAKIKSPALRNLYCEMVFLSVRLMRTSANGMRLCQMEILSPPVQLGKGVNQYINLISNCEGGFGCGHFCYSLENPEKIIILKIHIIYTMEKEKNPFAQAKTFVKQRQRWIDGPERVLKEQFR